MPNVTAPKGVPTLRRNRFNISSFRGVDLSNSPSNVKEYRSPEAPNMIPDLAGKPVKRTGYRKLGEYVGRINGRFLLEGKEPKELIHAGNKLYDAATGAEIYSGIRDTRTQGWQMNGMLWIPDGQKLLCYGKFGDSYSVKSAEEIAYIPIVVIARAPTGGGTPYEAVNLIQKKWTDSFLGTANVKTYQLSFGGLDSTKVTAKKLNSDGSWTNLAETTHFSVNRTTGVVTFTTAPGVSPIAGRDNVMITASKVRDGYADRINRCDVSVLYGVNGASDRLFLTGNPDFPNYDWYSQMNDPAYFGDLWYSVLGQDSSRIVGYSIINDRLAAHKDKAENGRNVVLRHGTLTDSKAAFPIISTLQGEGAIAKRAFGYLSNEPLFLTALGVFAITAQDVTGEKYSQNRSFYINKSLTEEPNLEDAFGFVYKNFYMLAVNSKVYILDGAQRAYEPNEPYSTFQYECYYWVDINARIMWQDGETLCFGNNHGEVMAFYEDYGSVVSFNDMGRPITAYWDLPDFDGKDFYKNKTIRYVAIRLASATATSVKILALIKGMWRLLKEEMTRARFFAYSKLIYSKFTYNCDTTPRTIGQKIKLKKVDKARFRLLNDQLNEPFGIYEVTLEYTENGYYKR